MSRRSPRLKPLLFLLSAGILILSEPARAAMDHHFIFFPETRLAATPALFDLPYRDVRFPAADGVQLHGWYLPGDDRQPLILFCHGNAGNISHRLDNLRMFHRLGVAVFIFDYRGYGQSQGKASEEGTYRDARGALAWLEKQGWRSEQMIYFGRSLGAGVALQLALEHAPAGLVLESPFPSVAALGWHHNPILYLLLGWTLNARYDNLSKLDRVQVPLLMFHGERDNIVPEKMARRLFERAREPKTYFQIPNAGHNDTYERGGEPYWEAWKKFLQQVRPATTGRDRSPPTGD